MVLFTARFNITTWRSDVTTLRRIGSLRDQGSASVCITGKTLNSTKTWPSVVPAWQTISDHSCLVIHLQQWPVRDGVIPYWQLWCETGFIVVWTHGNWNLGSGEQLCDIPYTPWGTLLGFHEKYSMSVRIY